MDKKPLIRIIFVCTCLFFTLSALMMGCNHKEDKKGEGIYSSISELSGKKIGVQVGTILDRMTKENVEDAEVLYFSSFPDIVVALKSNKIDAFPNGRMVLSQYLATEDSLALLDEEIGRNPAAYVFPKTEKGKLLRDQMNDFLALLRENGELSKIEEMWCGKEESRKNMIDYTTLPDTNGILTFLT